MLYNLHVLRVIAALGVVYYHITSEAGLNLETNIGSRGVDVFFVISGFIIAFIGSKKPDQFLLRRVIRIAPFYWAATLFVFAVVLVKPDLLRTTHADWKQLGASLAFIPRQPPGGDQFPTLVLGWSLNFEMFFYLWFALALKLKPGVIAPILCAAMISAYCAIVHVLGVDNAILTFWARPIVLEFVFGILVYYLFAWDALKPPKAVLLALIVASFALICYGEAEWIDHYRVIVAGIPSFVLVLSALLIEKHYRFTTQNKLVFLLGEASYIIYLIHPYIIYTVLRLVVGHRELGTAVIVPLVIFLLALTSALAVAIHLYFEKPVMSFLRRKLTYVA
ncbi:MAG TPA: acyltransferase [Kofleriaceae bacterium]|nr:acyltransferase [Kofleriaceae bacterium]